MSATVVRSSLYVGIVQPSYSRVLTRIHATTLVPKQPYIRTGPLILIAASWH